MEKISKYIKAHQSALQILYITKYFDFVSIKAPVSTESNILKTIPNQALQQSGKLGVNA